MNFPQFWARGQSGSFLAWRWSNHSVAEAQTLADQAAQQVAERFRTNGFANAGMSKSWGYYPNRPFREQMLQEIKDETNATAAVVTRNSYGCQVLNTARVMFVDIDLPEPPRPGLWQRLFGKPVSPPPDNAQNEALARIENWTRNHPAWGWRIYRTRSGLRLLATQGLVEADSSTTQEVFAALGSDPLYQKLCQVQKCFRARLTPKAWRCGISGRPSRWPWLTEKQEKQFQKWELKYQVESIKWATCKLIRQLGNPTVHPAVQSIIKLHDTATRVGSELPLA